MEYIDGPLFRTFGSQLPQFKCLALLGLKLDDKLSKNERTMNESDN